MSFKELFEDQEFETEFNKGDDVIVVSKAEGDNGTFYIYLYHRKIKSAGKKQVVVDFDSRVYNRYLVDNLNHPNSDKIVREGDEKRLQRAIELQKSYIKRVYKDKVKKIEILDL